MFFLFDENIPYKLARGLALIEEANHKSKNQAEIKHPQDYETQGDSDENQIRFAGSKNGTIISFDRDFKHMKSYYQLYKQYKVGVVVFRLQKKDTSYWGIVRTLILNWEQLKEKVANAQPPFAFEVNPKGVQRLEL